METQPPIITSRRRPAETAPNPESELNYTQNHVHNNNKHLESDTPTVHPSKSTKYKSDLNTNVEKEYNPDFIDMSVSDINKYINGQENKNTQKKTLIEVTMFTKSLK